MKNNGLYNPIRYGELLFLEIVKEYKIEDDRIIVTLADGFEASVPNDEEQLQKVQNHLQMQAETRDLHYSDMMKRGRTIFIINALASTTECILAGFWLSELIKDGGAFKAFLTGGLLYFSLSYVKNLKRVLDDMEDIKKYRVFLKLSKSQEYIEVKDDPEIYKGVLGEGEELSLNTIDNYSLKEVSKIASNVRKHTKPRR